MPPEQRALRSRLEAMAVHSGGLLRCAHEERFWSSENERETVYGWGTAITSASEPGLVVRVWFDGLDRDISLSMGPRGEHWREWRDLTDLDQVLTEVDEQIRRHLPTT